jgi:hypothetical protein
MSMRCVDCYYTSTSYATVVEAPICTSYQLVFQNPEANMIA